ncbi:MAG TPA: ATP-binding protein [Xanthobacteraceae bacterium]|nr:ATP-binding protein [Xanthobacteraceae bacterium]
MAALGKLLRTTVFRLTLVYLLIFILFAAALLAYFALNTRRLINEQITDTVRTEINGLTDQYERGGIGRVEAAVDVRSRRPGSNLYLLTTPAGEGLAGNIGALEVGALDHQGWLETSYRRLEMPGAPEGVEHRALVDVVRFGGFRLLVGRDLEERERLYAIITNAGRWAFALVVVLGIAGGFFVSRRVLKRIDAVTETAQTIMAGDLSGRLPVAGTGDELDRLADNLNALLDRIVALMHGLSEVSDNIAHDLKTPLTRLRNRCEQALRGSKNDADYRAALEATIEESDELIRTFDALLMIARAESGHARDNMTEFDAAEIARDVGELYEPLAEEKGLALKVEAPLVAKVRGNRELVSQALANLVDNAIKYGGPDGDLNGAPAEILVKAGDEGERIMLTVEDHGPGIPQADRSRVVERFVRLEKSRSEPGSGLGLSLASAIARLHGGELKLEDNDPGLRSTIALPRAGPAGAG